MGAHRGRSWSPGRVRAGGGGSEKLSGLQRGQRRELEPRSRGPQGTRPAWHTRPRVRGTRRAGRTRSPLVRRTGPGDWRLPRHRRNQHFQRWRLLSHNIN
ncbi:PREDICTED: uncharacterized protein LOC105591033 isoform X3 [Cercocebus atys]|uniref:uncharacterized protein LOC105591033 isoform X3 n=1 Tax=Cercocebus atys TaxID=9531 RepID=UPI0005F5477A|nr:PREDICTED: uncharacterized protein LOC105591033 isoform X3 [Cercocebus atys]